MHGRLTERVEIANFFSSHHGPRQGLPRAWSGGEQIPKASSVCEAEEEPALGTPW